MKINAAFNRIPASEPVSLYSATVPHPESGMEVLIISKRGKFNNTRGDDLFLIVDNPKSTEYDALFSEKMFADALESYYYIKASGRLIVDDGVQEFNIENSVEIVKNRGNGQAEYNIDLLQNGHLAFLATCHVFNNQQGLANCNETYNELDELYLTI